MTSFRTVGILNAVRGGVTSIEHRYGINDQAIEMAGERGTFLVRILSTVVRAIERAARIALGTDAAVDPHGVSVL
ncbi:hypothetical protein ACWGMA_45185 [Streptomyces asiaticus]